MKLEQAHIVQIRTAFEKMQSREDLLHLLNEAKPMVYGEKAVPFELKQLTWYANPKIATKRYSDFKIKKKSGAYRSIHAPVMGLKSLQKTLSFVLQCVFEPHHAAMGFVRDKSIVDNAKLHAGSKYVYNIDLKDFFPSIDQARVWKCLQLKPFNLNSSRQLSALKVNDGPKIGVYTLPNNLVNGDINDIIWKLKFDGYRFPQGTWNLKLKDGGNILYRIEKNSRKESEGNIKIFLNKSQFEGIKLLAKQLAENKNLDFDMQLKITIWGLIEFHQNKLHEKNTRLRLANIIASLCCTEMDVERKNDAGEWGLVKRNVLPQGAPTSPVITNIICQRLDYLLTGVANRFGLKYSRYADDITFSSMHNVYQPESDFLKELQRIITEQGFHIKECKTRLQKEGHRQEVTGLLVNEKVNVQHRYIKQLRMWLYYWERYGYERAYGFFLQQYMADKGNIVKGKPDMASVIGGKLDFLKMVKGADIDLYLKLKSRFDVLIGKTVSLDKTIKEPKEKSELHNPMINLLLSLNNEHLPVLQKPKVVTVEKNTPEKSIIPILHNPKELIALLKKFSVNDSALKYTTHSWDAGRDANMFKDLTEFLSIAKNQYNEFSFQLNSLSRNLHGKINSFLFNKDIAESGWGDPNPAKRIRFGWSSPELTEACNLDASLNPEDFIIPGKYQIQRAGKTLQKFKHVIDVFKNEIEIRDENSALLNLILQKHDNYLISFSDPKVSNLENKTFYTDIQWLSKALDLIFEGIQKYPQHPDVEYYVEDNGNDSIVLNILHRNSFKTGLSIHDDKLNLMRGDFSTIKDKLRNLCDWSIESQFAEGFYRINYLVSDKEIQAHQEIETTQGFKHILTFYK